MKMVNNWIACQNLDETIAEQGGIIVASKNNKYKRLEIKTLFEGHGLESEGLKEGAIVYVLATAGVEIPIDGVEYTVIKQHDIIIID